MARMIDKNELITSIAWHDQQGMISSIDDVLDIIEAYPTLTPQNEWVSVEERLPENGQIVLFHQKDGFIYCAEYFAGNALMSPGWFIDNDSWDAKEVTHWMPIPAPPKKEHDHE
ncbi:MAG: DUF551 domain-containing protein [Evtepia sp.]